MVNVLFRRPGQFGYTLESHYSRSKHPFQGVFIVYIITTSDDSPVLCQQRVLQHLPQQDAVGDILEPGGLGGGACLHFWRVCIFGTCVWRLCCVCFARELADTSSHFSPHPRNKIQGISPHAIANALPPPLPPITNHPPPTWLVASSNRMA
jgi:hypothetical protein